MHVRNRLACVYVYGCVLVHTDGVSNGNIHASTSLTQSNCISVHVTMTIKTRIDVFNRSERIVLISCLIPCDISVFVLRFSVPYRAICPRLDRSNPRCTAFIAKESESLRMPTVTLRFDISESAFEFPGSAILNLAVFAHPSTTNS